MGQMFITGVATGLKKKRAFGRSVDLTKRGVHGRKVHRPPGNCPGETEGYKKKNSKFLPEGGRGGWPTGGVGNLKGGERVW